VEWIVDALLSGGWGCGLPAGKVNLRLQFAELGHSAAVHAGVRVQCYEAHVVVVYTCPMSSYPNT
jgi:hypothetical protein